MMALKMRIATLVFAGIVLASVACMDVIKRAPGWVFWAVLAMIVLAMIGYGVVWWQDAGQEKAGRRGVPTEKSIVRREK